MSLPSTPRRGTDKIIPLTSYVNERDAIPWMTVIRLDVRAALDWCRFKVTPVGWFLTCLSSEEHDRGYDEIIVVSRGIFWENRVQLLVFVISS